jgi:hypothetical protein
MGCGDMEYGGVEIGDEEGSVEGEEPELTAEEQAAEDEWRAAEAKRAKIREQGRLRAERYRENHPEKVKERNNAHYYKNRYEICAQQNERNTQLRLARGAAAAAGEAGASNGAAAGGLHFGVLPGCRGMCSPAMCSGCLSLLRAGRHPVRQMCNEAYVIEAQEEKPLPVDAQEEAAFWARLAVAAGCWRRTCASRRASFGGRADGVMRWSTGSATCSWPRGPSTRRTARRWTRATGRRTRGGRSGWTPGAAVSAPGRRPGRRGARRSCRSWRR